MRSARRPGTQKAMLGMPRTPFRQTHVYWLGFGVMFFMCGHLLVLSLPDPSSTSLLGHFVSRGAEEGRRDHPYVDNETYEPASKLQYAVH